MAPATLSAMGRAIDRAAQPQAARKTRLMKDLAGGPAHPDWLKRLLDGESLEVAAFSSSI